MINQIYCGKRLKRMRQRIEILRHKITVASLGCESDFINIDVGSSYGMWLEELRDLSNNAPDTGIIMDSFRLRRFERQLSSFEMKFEQWHYENMCQYLGLVYRNNKTISNENIQIYKPKVIYLLRLAEFLFSPRTYRKTFLIIFGDWQEEYLKALSKKKIWKARWINIRYTYVFLLAMWLKSPIGDLIEYVSKLAK